MIAKLAGHVWSFDELFEAVLKKYKILNPERSTPGFQIARAG